MAARIIDGKAVAARIAAEIAERVATRLAAGRSRPGLAIVLVGDNPASRVFVRNKRKTIQAVGMRSFAHDLPGSASQQELLLLIDSLNADPLVHGILVQLPLPKHIDAAAISETIDQRKDVDGLYPYNIGRLVLKRPLLRPCSPYGCMRLLKETGQDLVGRDAVVIGDSSLVGRPMALELLMARCTTTICDPTAPALPDIIRGADVLVSGVDRPCIVKGIWIKPGAIVIDAGVHRNVEGKLCGDVEFEVAKERAAWITPVPGGVGPMTVAMLAANTLLATELQD